MKLQLAVLILVSGLSVAFEDESAANFTTISFQVPSTQVVKVSDPVTGWKYSTIAILQWYNWTVTKVDPLPGCNGGWKVSTIARCGASSCYGTKLTNLRLKLNAGGVQLYLVRADASFINITLGITHLCLQDGCHYTFNRQPTSTDSIQFFGIGDLNPLICNSTAVTPKQGGGWNVVFEYTKCQPVPKWFKECYEGMDLSCAQNLVNEASSVNVIDCVQFNNVNTSTVTFTTT